MTVTITPKEHISDALYQKLYQKGYRAGKREGLERMAYQYEVLQAKLQGAQTAFDVIKGDNAMLLTRNGKLRRVLRNRLTLGMLIGELLVVAAYFIGKSL